MIATVSNTAIVIIVDKIYFIISIYYWYIRIKYFPYICIDVYENVSLRYMRYVHDRVPELLLVTICGELPHPKNNN